MLFSMMLVIYILILIFDYSNIKKTQNKKQNILYLIVFFISFSFLTAYVFNLPIPILSDLFRSIIKKFIS